MLLGPEKRSLSYFKNTAVRGTGQVTTKYQAETPREWNLPAMTVKPTGISFASRCHFKTSNSGNRIIAPHFSGNLRIDTGQGIV